MRAHGDLGADVVRTGIVVEHVPRESPSLSVVRTVILQ